MVNDASIQSYFHAAGKSSLKQGHRPQTAANTQSSSPNNIVEEQHCSSPFYEGWHPQVEYQETEISSSIPGPGRVAITGRIANFFHLETSSKSPHAAKGCWKLIVKDDTGAIEVNISNGRDPAVLAKLHATGQVVVRRNRL